MGDEEKEGSKFRKSNQVEFCERHRKTKRGTTKNGEGVISVDAKTLNATAIRTEFDAISNAGDGTLQQRFRVQLSAHNAGQFLRLRVDADCKSAQRKPFDIPMGDVVLSQSFNDCQLDCLTSTAPTFKLSANDRCLIQVNLTPFTVDFIRPGAKLPFLSFNSDGLLQFVDNSVTPLKSPAADFAFPNCKNLYGLPEHADSLRLQRTVTGEPYRLFNVDNFGYGRLFSREALYGAVPFIMAPKDGEGCGIFWLNPSETWVDVDYRPKPKNDRRAWCHFMSETGSIDVFIFTGPTMRDVIGQYNSLVGRPPLPPLFALGYHQSRWNYNDQKDVLDINKAFDSNDIPCDVIWLDIEHTDAKKYFTWDQTKFPNPLEMLDQLKASGRRLVNIVDPHMKRDVKYPHYQEVVSKGFFVKDAAGVEDFQGNCWPGLSSWPDFTRAEVREWWSDQFGLDKYPGTNERVYVWNDMNEPAVFKGVELTMAKSAKHFGGVEHREVHNLYGHYQAMATFQGLVKRSENRLRPFVLTRSFFAGTQRYAAVWTGDNVADWTHLRLTTPMLLSLSISGFAFCGADVGGFHGNPSEEMLTRWFQAAAFHPFFREHNYQERREPWLFSKATNARLRKAVQVRYSYLPFWYTLFYELEQNGIPPMRPLWLEFPDDGKTYAKDSSFMVGDALFVHPICRPKLRFTKFYLPGKGRDVVWYRVDNWANNYSRGGRDVFEFVKIDEIPVYQRGGSIVPRWMQPRQSSAAMHGDRLTLIACLDRQGRAEGRVFVDDFDGYQYKDGKFAYCVFKFDDPAFSCRLLTGDPKIMAPFLFEKVLIVGLQVKSPPAGVFLQQNDGLTPISLPFSWDSRARCLEIAAPNNNSVPTIAGDFEILIKS